MSKFALKKIAHLEATLKYSQPSIIVAQPRQYRSNIKPKAARLAINWGKAKLNLSSLRKISIIAKIADDDRYSSEVGNILSIAKRMQFLNKKLHQQIGSPTSHHINLINIKATTVIIFADNSSWAQRARFKSNEIIAILNPYFGGELTKVSVQVKRY